MAYQSPRKAYDSPRKAYESPRQSYESPMRACESPRRAYESPRQSYDSPRRAYESPRVGYEESPPNGVYMFIRFRTYGGTSDKYVAQSCVLNKKAAINARGRFVGIARKIYDFSPDSKYDEACVVYFFETSYAAKRFFVSDPRFKQHDFPPPAGFCEAWSVVRYYEPWSEPSFHTFMMSEVQLTQASYTDYKRDFAQQWAQLLLEYDARPFVVQSMGVDTVRSHFPPPNTIVIVHLFKDREHLETVMKDDRFDWLRNVQRQMAKESCSVFTIDVEACP